jgi:predicted dinucleotide-binding enzyme
MNIGVFGTGMVGGTIGAKLISLGHNVMMGSREADNEKAVKWVAENGKNASQGTFADAAAFAEEFIFNCTSGMASLAVMEMAGKDNLTEKIIIDVSNPLDFTHGFPPTLSVCNDDSIGEQIQNTYPNAHVVKTLNTCNCLVMVNPSLVPGEHDVFVSGNNFSAKSKVTDILMNWFGWKNVIDLGDITTARGAEMMLPLWVRLYSAVGTPNFNFHIAR